MLSILNNKIALKYSSVTVLIGSFELSEKISTNQCPLFFYHVPKSMTERKNVNKLFVSAALLALLVGGRFSWEGQGMGKKIA